MADDHHDERAGSHNLSNIISSEDYSTSSKCTNAQSDELKPRKYKRKTSSGSSEGM